MTTTPLVLIPSKIAETASTPQYTSTNAKTAIDKLTTYNSTGAPILVTVNLVVAGGSASAGNAFTKNVAAGTTWTWPDVVGHILESGGQIFTTASATGVSLRASGRQFT